MAHFHVGIAFQQEHYLGLDKLILLTLADFANSETNELFPTYKTIQRRTGVSRRKAIDTVKKFVNDGILEKYHRYTDEGDNTSNLYLFNMEALRSLLNAPLQCAGNTTTGASDDTTVDTSVHPEIGKSKIGNSKPVTLNREHPKKGNAEEIKNNPNKNKFSILKQDNGFEKINQTQNLTSTAKQNKESLPPLSEAPPARRAKQSNKPRLKDLALREAVEQWTKSNAYTEWVEASGYDQSLDLDIEIKKFANYYSLRGGLKRHIDTFKKWLINGMSFSKNSSKNQSNGRQKQKIINPRIHVNELYDEDSWDKGDFLS